MKITKKDVYSTIVGHLTSAESITWNRFNSFLLVNSILFIAWTTIYFDKISPGDLINRAILLTIIAMVGIISGVFWAGLGLRGRKYVFEFLNLAKEI
jgi:hypothetical protein